MTFPDIPFPNRPLAIKASSITTPRNYGWAAPFMFVLCGLFLYWQVPDLWRDYVISQNPVIVENGQLRDGECRVSKGVLTICDAELAYTYNGRSYEGKTTFFFVDFHAGAYETDLVISADHPELSTVSLGIEKMWNRVISFAVVVAVLAGLCVTSVFLGFRVAWVRSRLTTPAPLKPIPVEITTFKSSFGRLFVTYADKIADDKTKRTAYTTFGKGQEPIILGEVDGSAVALAVRHGTTSLPVLLDTGLERIKMTDEERASVLASITAAQATAEGPQSIREPAKKGRFLRAILGLLAIILVIAGVVLGYWYWYVTAGYTQFMQAGMEINNMLPAPMNEWGCDQLQKRFGDQNAPYGCTASDFKSWK